MKCKAGLFLIGLIIVFLLITIATDPKRGTREERDTEPVQQRQHNEDLLKCPQSSVTAAVGEDVTLDFHFEPKPVVTLRLIEWNFNKSTHVLVYRSEGFSANDQDEQFKGRASLDSSGKINEGKLQLKISNVTTDDAGTYSCFVQSKEKETNFCSTELIISTDSGKRAANKAPNRSGSPFVLVLTVSTFLYLLCY